MNKSWDLRSFRNDLSSFIETIERNRVPGEFESLKSLLSDLDLKNNINYKLDDLVLYINGKPRGVKFPNDLSYVRIFFCNKIYQKHTICNQSDPVHEYSLNINIHAFLKKGDADSADATKCYKSCWHLDQEYGQGASNRVVHPSYHFQFGGKNMNGLNTGMVAILGAPRIPHPPMDIFLGFHFILLNFFDRKNFSFVDDLIKDYEYRRIILRAQKRLWRPYFNSYVPDHQHNDFILAKTFPCYIHDK